MTMNRLVQPIAVLFFLVFFTIASIHFSFCYGNHDVVMCLESEKQALSTFKRDLEDPSNRLSSWEVEDDCCKWAGVVCDNLTGHVLELQLGNPITSFYDHYERLALRGKINPSLLNLKHLRYLDLSLNDFERVPIPSFIGSLASLQYLNLSGARFVGTIPHQLGNLSSLRYLSLASDFYFDFYRMNVENLQWLLGVSHLEHLDLSYVNLNKAPNWLQVINELPYLVELHLSSCLLSPNLSPLLNVNFTSLEYLDLSNNELKGPFPVLLSNMTSLRHLDVSGNKLEGSLPRFLGNLCNLSFVDLSTNNFSGELFISSSKCPVYALETLFLSNNHLSGHLPDELEQFKNVRHVYLGNNFFSGSIPTTIGRLASLQTLNLERNQLNGTLPQSFGQLSKLQHLDVSNNLLKGIVSEVHFTNLINLRKLYASENRLTVKVSPNWIPPFQLEEVKLASWHLGPKFPTWLQSQKDLKQLDLSYSGILDGTPIWFWNLSSSLYALDLSHNQIHGEIPYLLGLPNAQSVYLNSNHFNGPIPRISSRLSDLDLSDNSFSGGISHFLCDRNDEQKSLHFLNLKQNLLSGEIPDCWMSWQSLAIIEMGNNKLTGNIPRTMGLLGYLQSLHLRNNYLFGEISPSLQNFTYLQVLDLSENEFQGSIPTWMAERLPQLTVLTLRSNKLNGVIPPELCRLFSLKVLDLANNTLFGAIPQCINNFVAMEGKEKYIYPTPNENANTLTSAPAPATSTIASAPTIYHAPAPGSKDYLENELVVTKGRVYQYDKILTLVTSLDLSNNNISGNIPEELTILQGLISLNLSGNHLTGVIPEKISNMRRMESLDLSKNQLCGEIPPTISSLNFLSYLNLSYNNLSGQIPSGTQLQTFNASSFIGNNLCGLPLTKNCTVNGQKPNVGNDGDRGGSRLEMDWFYLFMALGFAVGFWGVCAPILFIKSWRYAYFRFLDNVWTRLVLLYMSNRV